MCGLVVLAAPDPNPLKLPKDCGRVPAKRDRIAGGYFADDGAFPSYVRLVFEMRNRTDVKGSLTGLCGAIIISERLILTAAHCIRERRGDYRILVDLVSSRPGNSTNSRFEHMANTVCMPKHWLEVVPVKIDLAVVQLNRPLTFDKYTQPACLPDSRVDEQTQLFNVGMGSTANETISTNLKALRSKRAKCGRFHDQPTYICTQPSDAKVPGSACQGELVPSLIFSLSVQYDRTNLQLPTLIRLNYRRLRGTFDS